MNFDLIHPRSIRCDPITLCVVLENCGVVVGEASLADVFKRFEAFIFAAKTIL